ncbi:hypothetical protein ACROYT_G008947 [Oculina patagonica]
MHQLCSSYFKFSNLKRLHKDSDSIAEYKADSELNCALRCNTRGNCDEATFNRESKKCSLYQIKDKGTIISNTGDDSLISRTVSMKKVTTLPNKSNGDCPSNVKSQENTDSVQGKNQTTGVSCSDILQKDSSSATGNYRIKIGNVTWKTRCRMDGIPGCGNGVWALVMRVNGSENTFSFGSHHWTSKIAYQKAAPREGQETKLPGYWLSNFTKICVTMHFPVDDDDDDAVSKNTTFLLVNHTAQSLYSVLQDGNKTTLPADLTNIETLPNIDKRCLIQGLNMLGPYPWIIKSRIGVESAQSPKCPLPFLVRGVGIGFQQQGSSEISCGEFIISYSYQLGRTQIERYPAFCRVYIQ